MKRLAILLVLVAGLMLGVPSGALCYDYTFADVVGDVTGAPLNYEIYGIDVVTTASNITFQLYTNYEQGVLLGGFLTCPGDLFIDAGGNGTYEYAVALTDHTSSTQPGATVTAQGLYHNPAGVAARSSGFYWNGRGIDPNKWVSGVPVTIHDDQDPSHLAGAANVVWGSSDKDGDTRIDVTVALSLLGGFDPDNMGIRWAVATCGNDTIEGERHLVAAVPEPATALLVGTGLLVLAGYGRKKALGRKKKLG